MFADIDLLYSAIVFWVCVCCLLNYRKLWRRRCQMPTT